MKFKFYVFIISIQIFNLNGLPRRLKKQANQFDTIDASFITSDQSFFINSPFEIDVTTLPTIVDQDSTLPTLMVIDEQNFAPQIIIETPLITSLDSDDLDTNQSLLINDTQAIIEPAQIIPNSNLIQIISSSPDSEGTQQIFAILESDLMDIS